MRFYDHERNPILLGEELGRGGEGSVYTIEGDTTNVSKIYHKPVDNEKAEKLQLMVGNSRDLANFTAWPSTTLHDQPGGKIKGFVMPRVSGHHEVHELYGPAHRKLHFPRADWSFLIQAARNIAAAFQVIHAYGHTVGDVNQSGILISQNALCRLIDTDSFQIRLGNRFYFCEVGTPHFTPPELQGKSFRGVLRNENHDNFGLAVIIFQLLFMGRHPFAGRYFGSGDMPIEKAIQEYRFSFSARASIKKVAPPPNTLDLSVCTSSIAQFFEKAFSEEGSSQGNRPKAQEWTNKLDGLLSELCSCKQNSLHKYHRSLSSCPWCKLENMSSTVYFRNDASNGSTQSKFDIEDIWSRIQAVKIPSLEKLPDVNSIKVTPNALPEYAKPPSGFLGIVNVFFNFHNDGGERKKRESSLREAENKWKEIERRYVALKSDSDFDSVYQSLQLQYNEYKNFSSQYQTERKNALLKVYLERYLIENAAIPNIGKKRVLTLEYYGIETAADISYNRIIWIPGFGEVLTQNLVDWRDNLEIRFNQYKPSLKDLAALNGLDQKYARRRSELESKFLGGKARLEYIYTNLIKEREQVRKEAEDPIKKLAQALADMKVYS